MNFEQTNTEKQNQRVKVTMRCKAMMSTTMRPNTMLFTNTTEAKPNERNLEGVHHNINMRQSMTNCNAVAALVKRNRRVKVAMRCETMLSRTMRSSTMRFTNTTEGETDGATTGEVCARGEDQARRSENPWLAPKVIQQYVEQRTSTTEPTTWSIDHYDGELSWEEE